MVEDHLCTFVHVFRMKIRIIALLLPFVPSTYGGLQAEAPDFPNMQACSIFREYLAEWTLSNWHAELLLTRRTLH